MLRPPPPPPPLLLLLLLTAPRLPAADRVNTEASLIWPNAQGSQNSFLQIVFPEKLEGNASNNVRISYIIAINEKLYTVHLMPRYFLAKNFTVYFYDEGILNSQSSDIQRDCYYEGYIEGYQNSVATLNICSGLRGTLQFENVSYGIEPLDSAVEFQHVLYQLGNENNELGYLTQNSRSVENYPGNQNIFVNEKAETPVPDSFPLYLEMYIVVDKALYDYLGSDSTAVTNKVIEMINIVNSVLAQLEVTLVLSSLELWSDKNKISTAGEADELLHRFSEWKQSHLSLKPHDVAYLFIHRDHPDYVGATFPGKMCVAPYSAGIALYPKDITLEAFSVIVTQMLALSLGIAYDDPVKCRCSDAVCVMNLEAVQSSGVKPFSKCSLSDFQSFISNMGTTCLQNKPEMQSEEVCGNGIREGNERCDCGTKQECGVHNCCNHTTCQLKSTSQCLSGPCCHYCLFSGRSVACRPRKDSECDLDEHCTGQGENCPPDMYIQNGHSCNNRAAICFRGVCVNIDLHCQNYFGKDSKSAPFLCYKEVHGHTDRFGNCGLRGNSRLYCGWRNFKCGRLVCTYPSRTPYFHVNASVMYLQVKNNTCITADFTQFGQLAVFEDPFRIPDGAACDVERICYNFACLEARHLTTTTDECRKKCSERGVCNNRGNCYCDKGYEGETCEQKISRSAPWDINKGLILESASEKAESYWLLSFYIGLSILIIATITAVAWNRLKKVFTKEEESLTSESISEDTTQAYTSRSKSEASSN